MTEQEYAKICQKLGFDPIVDKSNYPSMADDTKPSRYSVLTLEEKEALLEYLIDYNERRKINRP